MFTDRTCVGTVGHAAAIADLLNRQVFAKVVVVQIFGEALGLFGLIVGIIMSKNIEWV